MSIDTKAIARERIAHCRRHGFDHLNLACLELTDEDLDGNKDFAALTQLHYLDLTGNQLKFLPEAVANFTSLIWLGLNFNKLRTVKGVERCVHLRRLYLRGNGLSFLPEIGALSELQELDLTGNAVPWLPYSMGRLEKLEHLGVSIEPLIPDLRAAWEQEGWASLRKHLATIDQALGEQPPRITYAAKVILVGDRQHGKTCLQKALRGESTEQQNPSTEGMNRVIMRLDKKGNLATSDAPDVLNLSIWDMGGQYDYWHMHQLLFTRQAIYLVVMKARQGDLDRWLKLIQRRTGGEAKVVVVFTHGVADASFSLDGLRALYQGLDLRALHVVNTVIAPEEQTPEILGLEKLRQILANMVREEGSPFAHQWQRGWAEVFRDMEEAGKEKPYLTWDQAAAKCAARGITAASDQELILRTGQLMGAFLWRNDIPEGREVVVLRPEWLNRAVARLLDNDTVRENHGLIDRAALKKLWLEDGRDGEAGFELSTHNTLIELMKINELAYQPKSGGQPESNLLLLTQRVEDRTMAEIDREWEKRKPESCLEARQIIAFAYRDGSLGFGEVQGLIYLLIFRLRAYGLGRRDYKEAVHWQSGLLVSDDYGSVARIELREKELHITLRYVRSDHLFYIIGDQIGPEDDEMWNGLLKRQFVLCGEACPRLPDDRLRGNGRVSVQSCHKALGRGRSLVVCGSGGICDEEIEIARVLPPTRAIVEEAVREESQLKAMVNRLIDGDTHFHKEVLANFDDLKALVEDTALRAKLYKDELIAAIGGAGKPEPRLFSLKPVDKNWWDLSAATEVEFDLTLWCEWTLTPVPFLENDLSRGTVRVKLARPWVASAKKVLNFSIWALRAWKTGGMLAGKAKESAKTSKEEKGWIDKALDACEGMEKHLKEAEKKDLEKEPKTAKSTSSAGVPEFARRGFGDPLAIERAFVDDLRKAFHDKAHGWAGLEPFWHESRWFMRHPKWQAFGKSRLAGG